MARAFDDGSSQDISADYSAISAYPLSLACWFNSDDITVTQTLVSLSDTAGSVDFVRIMAAGNIAGDPVRAQVRRSSPEQADTSTSYSAGTWHHACGTFGSNTSRIAYLDGGGKVEDTTTRSIAQSLDKFSIGSRLTSSPTNYMSGSIAEVGVWDVVLTDAEVAILADGYSPLLVRPANLLLYVPLVRGIQEYKGLALTNNGSTVSVHPRVFHPTVPYYVMAPAGAPAGWTGKINGVTNPAKVNGVAVANIVRVNGVA